MDSLTCVTYKRKKSCLESYQEFAFRLDVKKEMKRSVMIWWAIGFGMVTAGDRNLSAGVEIFSISGQMLVIELVTRPWSGYCPRMGLSIGSNQ